MHQEPAVRLRQAHLGLQPPLDAFDSAVRLEVQGVTDEVAQSEFGYADTFAMARANPGCDQAPAEACVEPAANWLVAYFRGVSFAIPVLMCALSMYLLGYSLWGGDVPGAFASAIAVGTVSSFLVTGGVIQGMARRSLFYFTTGAVGAGAGACLQWCGAGVVALTTTGVLGLALNANFGWMPPHLAGIAVAFHASLGLLWLSCGVLYILDRSTALGVVTLAGLAAVWLFSRVGQWPLVGAQIGGILVATTAAAGLSVWALRRRLGNARVMYPATSVSRTVYLAGPYFLFGLLYYFFLFLDRLLAWTAATGSLPMPLWFRGDYEVPLDVALVAFVLTVGWVHPSLLRFQASVSRLRRQSSIAQLDAFHRDAKREYWRRSVGMLGWGVGVTAAVWVLAAWWGVPGGAHSLTLTAWGLVGYLALAFGLWNTSLLFSLSLPKPILQAIGLAVVIDLALGYVLTRVFSYEAAVGGFAAGAAVFAVMSARGALARLRSLDYFHYAAAL
jgi:hypothetical protein